MDSYVYAADMSPAAMDTSKDYSLECLVRGNSLGPDMRFADLITSEAFFLHKYESGGISLGTCTGTNGSYSECNPGSTGLFNSAQWYHIVVSVTAGTTVYFFVNGNQLSNGVLANRYHGTVSTLSLGMQRTAPSGQGNSPFYNGFFGLARLWSKALVLADVKTLLSDPENAPRANLLVEYLFSRQNPLSFQVTDSGPFGVDAVITNPDVRTPVYTGTPIG